MRSGVREVTCLSLVRHMGATIVGNIGTRGAEKEVGQRRKRSGTGRTGTTHTRLLQDSLACAGQLDRWNIGI